MATVAEGKLDTLRALPGDDVRQILWRFTDRYDLQMLVQSARAVARGPVARLENWQCCLKYHVRSDIAALLAISTGLHFYAAHPRTFAFSRGQISFAMMLRSAHGRCRSAERDFPAIPFLAASRTFFQPVMRTMGAT